jgi:hypothetical protein
MAASLQAILDAELVAGNVVAEVSDWPPKCELFVLLRRPFARRYAADGGLQFAEVNDSHYWKAEYRFDGGVQVLACGFK